MRANYFIKFVSFSALFSIIRCDLPVTYSYYSTSAVTLHIYHFRILMLKLTYFKLVTVTNLIYIIFNLAFSDCTCDLTYGGCDYACCCDTDCSASII